LTKANKTEEAPQARKLLGIGEIEDEDEKEKEEKEEAKHEQEKTTDQKPQTSTRFLLY